MISREPSKRTNKMYRLLEAFGINDDDHCEYLRAECENIDLMNGWENFLEACAKGKKNVNPDDLIVNYLLDISSVDPLCKRTIAYHPDGIADTGYKPQSIVFYERPPVVVHQRSLVEVNVKTGFKWRDKMSVVHQVDAGKNYLFPEAVRPGMTMIINGEEHEICMVLPANDPPDPSKEGAISKWEKNKDKKYEAYFETEEARDKFVKKLYDLYFEFEIGKFESVFYIRLVSGMPNSFMEIKTDEKYIDHQGVVLMPRVGMHWYVETNEFPDIDIDYEPAILDKIIPWCSERFGDGHVIGVATYQRMQCSSAFKDVCRVYGIPLMEVLRVAEAFPEEAHKLRRFDKDFEEQWSQIISSTEEIQDFLNVPGEEEKRRNAFDIVKRIMGKTRTFGQHASAMIISSVNTKGLVPTICRRGGPILSSWVEGLDRTDLSKMGFIKFDRLSLKTLENIKECLKLVYQRGHLNKETGLFRRKRPDWSNDPIDDWMYADWSNEEYLDDKRCIAAFGKGDSIGCFQFESPGIRHMLKEISIDNFEEICASNAMYRPGVLKAKIDGVEGGDKAFIARKRKEISYSIPEKLEELLSSTYGLLVYQEQVMKVLEIAGGVPSTECEMARKAISKKKIEVLNKYKEKFKNVAPKTVGWTEEEAAKYFDDNIVTWSGYGFNRSHSLSYAIIAMRTMYLKVYYTIEFYCAFISAIGNKKGDDEKIREFIADASMHGVKIIGVDINESKNSFVISPHPRNPHKEVIRYGLGSVKKVGKSGAEIVDNQPYRSFGDYLNRGVSRKDVVVNLIHAGAFDRFSKNRYALITYYEEWKKISKRKIGIVKYKAFLKEMGLSPDQIKDEAIIFKNECEKIKYGDDEDELIEEEEDSPLSVESQDSYEIPLLDIVSEETSKILEEAKVERKPVTSMDPSIFKMWVRMKWADIVEPHVIDLALENSMSGLVLPDLDESVPDMAPSIRLLNSVESYGSMLPFLNPINYVVEDIMWIGEYGKEYEDSNGYKRIQDHVDGYVIKVEKRKVSPEKGGGFFWKVWIDDGYERTSVTIWNDIWEGKGWRSEEIAKDAYDRPIITGRTSAGSPVYKKVKIVPPCEVIREGRVVRIRIKNKTRWGLSIDDAESGSPARLLETTRDWPNR
jgi:hypothetical protein